MPRKQRQKVKVNSVEALEGLLQETYNEACSNINAAQKEMNKLDKSTEPEDVDDFVKIAKETGNFLKIKESNVRIKLEVAKIQHDSIKQNGNTEKTLQEYAGQGASSDDLAEVRKMILEKKAKNLDE